MAEQQILSTLKRKQHDIRSYIADLDKRLEQAKHDLAHVNATLRLFEIDEGAARFPAYVSFTGLYRKGELTTLCLEALEGLPDRSGTSKDVAAYIIAKKGWDATDKALYASVCHSAVSTLGQRWRRRLVEKVGKRDGAVLWRLTP